MTATPLLKIDNVFRTFSKGESEVRALQGVSLEIQTGEFVAIMGQSGSGKSTLMNILGCLDKPNEGKYTVNGTDVANLDADGLAALRRNTFGFIFQRYNLLATASAEENVEIPAIYAGLAKPERAKRGEALLKKLGLGERGDHYPSELSGGQQQRVAIARALVNDPPVILADEPTGALDSKSGKEVLALLADLHREGRTIILITHDEHVAAHAKRVIRIQDGKIVEDKRQDDAPVASAKAQSKSGHAPAAFDIAEAVKMAVSSLRVNIFRTALTLLGIIIGVAAVIIMLAVGDGSKQKVLNQISAMGTNLLSVRPGAPGIRGGGDIITLIPEDAAAISGLPNVDLAVPERSGRFTVRYGNIDYMTSVSGVGHLFPAARSWPTTEGSFFTERDVRSNAAVVLLGKTVAKNLFPGDHDPMGEYILVKNIPFQVIGIMSEKGASGFGTDQDDAVFIPYTTAMIRLFGRPYLNSISVKVADVDQINQTQDAITALLKNRHRTEDFSIRNSASILETATETQNTLTILLGAVAAISLLVGGIGVMNIMLVSVTERTREIGIRMAVGARQRDILLQFNTEAAIVCTVGGIIGVLIGFAGGWIVSTFDIAVLFSAGPAILAFLCAVATGLLFGYLPARKAAWLDPVVALASE
ncbi:MAG: MacB family efflux pump subunit [Alphaproteobacteria bacterium]|nr:MAG: MacB family efflux pump subunit [Alphaproteobacteria bacterium]